MLCVLNEQSTGGLKVVWICIVVSVLAHVALALISPGIMAIFKPELEKPEKKKSAERKVVIAMIPRAPAKLAIVPKPPQPKEPPKVADNADKKATTPKPTPKPKPRAPQAEKKEQDIAKKPKPKPKPKPKGLFEPRAKLSPEVVRTSEDQPAGIPEDTNLLGERDTLASSNAEVNPNAPNRSAIKGQDSTFNETTNTSYQDGDLAHMNKGAESKLNIPEPPTEAAKEIEVEPSKLADKAMKEAKSRIVETDVRGDALEKKEKKEAMEASILDDEVKKYLESENKALAEAKEATAQNDIKKKSEKPKDAKESQKEQNTIANKKVDPDALKQKSVEEKQVRKKKAQLKQTASKSAKQGFRSETKATRFEGSISRRSRAGSNDVKATPLGKYMAEVSKLVEREWQRRCSLKGDLIQPGTLRMSFLLDSRGKITRIDTISQTYGSAANHSITFQAINSAKIPQMPSKVRAVQNGDPIEFTYTFSF